MNRGAPAIVAGLAVAANPVAADAAGTAMLRWHTPGSGSGLVYATEALSDERVKALNATDASVVQPEYSISIHFGGNGNIEEKQRRTVQFLKPGAFAEYGNMELAFDASTTSTTIRRAVVVRNDGSSVPVASDTVQVVNNAGAGVFSDDVNVVVPWAGLKVGAVGVLEATLTTRKRDLAMPWSRLIYPQGSIPRGVFRLSVTWDDGIPEPLVRSDASFVRCGTTRPQLIECVATSISPTPTDPNARYADELPGILVAERTTWPKLAERMLGYVESAVQLDPSIVAKAQELTRDAPDEKARFRQLHSFVSREVRYLGLEHGEKGFVPEKSALTLRRRYGDCKDKSVLFLALARAAGLDSFAVLTSTSRKNAARIQGPSSAYFDHMVVCVNLPGRERRCVDLTDDTTATDGIAYHMSGALALELRPGVSTTSSLPRYKFGWVLDETSDNEILEDGTIEELQRRRYAGTLAGWIRGRLRDLDPKARIEQAVGDYQDWIGTKAKPEFSFHGLENQQAAPELISTTLFPRILDRNGPGSYSDRLIWLEDLANSAATRNEHFSYDFPGIAYVGVHKYRAHSSWRLDWLGPTIDFKSRFGTVERRYRRDGQVVSVSTRVFYPGRMIRVEELTDFRKSLNNLESNLTIQFGIADGR